MTSHPSPHAKLPLSELRVEHPMLRDRSTSVPDAMSTEWGGGELNTIAPVDLSKENRSVVLRTEELSPLGTLAADTDLSLTSSGHADAVGWTAGHPWALEAVLDEFGSRESTRESREHGEEVTRLSQLAPHVGTADFVGSAEAFKQLFRMPFTDEEVSLLVHRVGPTIVMEGDPRALASQLSSSSISSTTTTPSSIPLLPLPKASTEDSVTDVLDHKDRGESKATKKSAGVGSEDRGEGEEEEEEEEEEEKRVELRVVSAHMAPSKSPIPLPHALPTSSTPSPTTSSSSSIHLSRRVREQRAGAGSPSVVDEEGSDGGGGKGEGDEREEDEPVEMGQHERRWVLLRDGRTAAVAPAYMSEDEYFKSHPPTIRKVAEKKTVERKDETDTGRVEEGVVASLAPATTKTIPSESSSTSPPPQPTQTPPDRRRKAFRRLALWEFNGLKLVLGSDLLVFRHVSHPAPVSLVAHDVRKPMTREKTLDLFLDNVLASVPEVAICFHDRGRVQSYEVVATDEVPVLGEEPFSPYAVEQAGATLLRFLQETCKGDCASFWLFRGRGDSFLQLFRLDSHDPEEVKDGREGGDGEKDGGGSESGVSGGGSGDGASSSKPWRYIAGALCYRLAGQHTLDDSSTPSIVRKTKDGGVGGGGGGDDKREKKERKKWQGSDADRRRRLLWMSTKLLTADGPSKHADLRAQVQEELSDALVARGRELRAHPDRLLPSTPTSPLPPIPPTSSSSLEQTAAFDDRSLSAEACLNSAARLLLQALEAAHDRAQQLESTMPSPSPPVSPPASLRESAKSAVLDVASKLCMCAAELAALLARGHDDHKAKISGVKDKGEVEKAGTGRKERGKRGKKGKKGRKRKESVEGEGDLKGEEDGEENQQWMALRVLDDALAAVDRVLPSVTEVDPLALGSILDSAGRALGRLADVAPEDVPSSASFQHLGALLAKEVEVSEVKASSEIEGEAGGGGGGGGEGGEGEGGAGEVSPAPKMPVELLLLRFPQVWLPPLPPMFSSPSAVRPPPSVLQAWLLGAAVRCFHFAAQFASTLPSSATEARPSAIALMIASRRGLGAALNRWGRAALTLADDHAINASLSPTLRLFINAVPTEKDGEGEKEEEEHDKTRAEQPSPLSPSAKVSLREAAMGAFCVAADAFEGAGDAVSAVSPRCNISVLLRTHALRSPRTSPGSEFVLALQSDSLFAAAAEVASKAAREVQHVLQETTRRDVASTEEYQHLRTALAQARDAYASASLTHGAILAQATQAAIDQLISAPPSSSESKPSEGRVRALVDAGRRAVAAVSIARSLYRDLGNPNQAAAAAFQVGLAECACAQAIALDHTIPATTALSSNLRSDHAISAIQTAATLFAQLPVEQRPPSIAALCAIHAARAADPTLINPSTSPTSTTLIARAAAGALRPFFRAISSRNPTWEDIGVISEAAQDLFTTLHPIFPDTIRTLPRHKVPPPLRLLALLEKK